MATGRASVTSFRTLPGAPHAGRQHPAQNPHTTPAYDRAAPGGRPPPADSDPALGPERFRGRPSTRKTTPKILANRSAATIFRDPTLPAEPRRPLGQCLTGRRRARPAKPPDPNQSSPPSRRAAAQPDPAQRDNDAHMAACLPESGSLRAFAEADPTPEFGSEPVAHGNRQPPFGSRRVDVRTRTGRILHPIPWSRVQSSRGLPVRGALPRPEHRGPPCVEHF